MLSKLCRRDIVMPQARDLRMRARLLPAGSFQALQFAVPALYVMLASLCNALGYFSFISRLHILMDVVNGENQSRLRCFARFMAYLFGVIRVFGLPVDDRLVGTTASDASDRTPAGRIAWCEF